MWLLRQRQAQGSAAFPVNIEVVDEQTLLVTSAKPAEVEGDPPVPVVTRVIASAARSSPCTSTAATARTPVASDFADATALAGTGVTTLLGRRRSVAHALKARLIGKRARPAA